MAQYINKSALVAEINKLENKLYYEPENFKDVGAKMALDSLKSFLDTLEVKEIEEKPVSEDFEKIVEEIVEPTILNAYGTKELARRLRNTICGTSVSEDLEKAEKEWLTPQLDKSYADYGETKMMELTRFDGYAMLDAIEFGANWQKQQFEKERLKHCDELTAEQAQIESDFVTKHLKENNRTPTFIDAIEYGMKLKKEPSYITKKVGECTTTTKVIKKGEKV